MHCKTCNTEITNEGRIGKIAYCPACGNMLASVCRKCGKELRDEDKFCYFCGEPVEQEPEEATESDSEEVAEKEEGVPTDDVPY